LGAFAATYLLWGSTFLALRYAVSAIPPLLTIAFRCAGGAAVLAGWLAFRGELRWPNRHELITGLMSGGLLFLVCHGALAWAEQRVPSGQAAVYMATIPLWMVVLSSLWQRRWPNGLVLTGLTLGLVGTVLLSGGAGAGATGATDAVVLVMAALAWAGGSLIGRHHGASTPAALSTVYQLVAGALLLITVSTLIGEPAQWNVANVTPRAVGGLLFLILAGTVIGMAAYNWLLRVTTPAMAGSYAFVNPVVAVLLAWVVGDGVITARTLAATGCVVAAVMLCRLGANRPSLAGRVEPALRQS
jgi:drug/metabolite transporter (DMT)-like permease